MKMSKRIISILLSLLLFIPSVALLGTVDTSAYRSPEEIYDSVMGIENIPPSDFGEEKDPYGYGRYKDFMLVQQNELFVVKTNGSSQHTLKSYDNLEQVNTGYPTNNAESTSYTIASKYTLSFSQSVAFDPTGSGRKDHIAVIGVWDNDDNPYAYMYVMDKEGHLSDCVKMVKATWMNNSDTLNNRNMWDFNAMNFIGITAGDYDGDGKDSIVYWVCGSTPTLKEVEVTNNNGNITFEKLSGDGYPDSQGSLMHKKYWDTDDTRVGNRMHAAIETGDVNADGLDDLVVLSYIDRSSYRDEATLLFVPSLSVSYGVRDRAQSVVMGEQAVRRIYVQENNKPLQSESEFHVAPAAAGLAVGDTNGNGRDEIVISGFYHEIKGYIGEDGNHEADNAYYDLDHDILVTAIYDGIPNFTGYGSLTRLCFDHSLATNTWTQGGDTAGGLYLSDSTTGDHSWQQTCVETVAINGRGNAEMIFVNGDLYSFETGRFAPVYSPDYFAEVNGATGDHVNEETYFRSAAVGNFDGNEEGSEQVAFVLGAAMKADTGNVAYSFGMLGGNHINDEGEYESVATSYYCTSPYSLEYLDNYYPSSSGASCEYDDCLSFDLCSWDNDSDGIHARYVDKNYIYTDPDVAAIVQAPPYFDAVESAMTGHTTTYSTTTSYEYETGEGNSVSFSVGGVLEAEAGVLKINAGAGYATDWSETFTEGLSVSCENTITAIGEDQVLLTRTPVTNYIYQIEVDGEWSDENLIVLSFPGTPAQEAMSLTEYNSFAAYYNQECEEQAAQVGIDNDDVPHLEIVDDIWLGNEGNPYGYMKKSEVTSDTRILQTRPNRFGVGSSSTGFSWSEEHSSGTERTSAHGFSFDFALEFGWGGSPAKYFVGVQVSLQYMKEKSVSEKTAEGEGASCEIGNMDPALLAQAGIPASAASQYSFTYQMASWPSNIISSEKAEDDTTVYVPIYGYVLGDLSQGVPPVTDLDSEFVKNDNDELNIKLTWSNPDTAGDQIGAFSVYQIQKNGDIDYVATVDADTTEYLFTDIDGRNEYSFIVRSKRSGTDTAESLNSNITYLYLDANAIYAIELTASDENSDTYTLTHTDGSTSEIVVRHGSYVTDVSLASSSGGTDTYSMTFSDGTTATFTVKNGTDGNTPQLRINGETNFWEVSYDNGATWTPLGVKATGENGQDGSDGITPQLRINNETNYWEVSYDNGATWASLNVKATGENGQDGNDGVSPKLTIGADDYWYVSYDNGQSWQPLGVKQSGSVITGADGKTPQLRINTETNFWEVSYDDGASWASLGVKATGTGIMSIGKTDTNGNVDTYTVTLTNGDEYTFTVANGINGVNGSDGEDGTGIASAVIDDNGKLVITLSDGSVLDLGAVKGKDGENGADGKGISTIAFDHSDGNTDTYIITYTDNTTSTFTITNGADGQNGADGVGIRSAAVNTDGELIIVLTDGNTLNLGNVKGADGQDGADGKTPQLRINSETDFWEVSYDNGATWESLGVKATGENGQNGADGEDGKTPKLRINDETNFWEVSYDDGATWESLGIKATGESGTDGQNGADGVGIASTAVNESGELIITLTNGNTFNLGKITGSDGKDGEQGEKGDAGEDGATITSMYYNESGELIIRMSNGSVINAGKPSADGSDTAGKPVVSITGYKVSRKVRYRTTITFHCTATFIPDGYEIHWYVNGQDKGTGDLYTVNNAHEDFFVCARLMKDGSSLTESEVEKVDVKSSFFNRLLSFFLRIIYPQALVIDQK